MTDVFVTNRNDFTYVDAYDGVEYVFPKGERIQIPVEAATHMLGFGKADKTETLTRLGWANRYDQRKKTWVENEKGIQHLSNFIFTQGVLVEIEADDSVPLTAPKEVVITRKKHRKPPRPENPTASAA